jgi:hypothetical protein
MVEALKAPRSLKERGKRTLEKKEERKRGKR